jgi:RNA polymerase sigma-70 factor, ECF subfamily
MKRTPDESTVPQSLDLSIVSAARAGDAHAIEAVVIQCYPSIRRFLRYLADDSNIADDLTQDVMLSAAVHLPTLSSDTLLMPWLYQMARNALHSYGRRQRRRLIVSLDEWMERASGKHDVAKPVSAVDEIEDDIVVRQLLNGLSSIDREVMYLRHAAGFTAAEIASVVGISHAATRQRIHRAVSALRGDDLTMPVDSQMPAARRLAVDDTP